MKFTALMLVLLLSLSACTREESAGSAATAAPETAGITADTSGARGNPGAAQATAPAGRIALALKDVQVTLTDSGIDMTATLPPGEAVFNVTNAGTAEHSFAIEGSGVVKKLDRSLQPGQSSKLQLGLGAGTYTIYCPVADHQRSGTTLQLTVRQP